MTFHDEMSTVPDGVGLVRQSDLLYFLTQGVNCHLVANELSQLRKRLSECLTRDVWRFERTLRTLSRAGDKALIGKLTDDMAVSCQRVAERRARLPELSFPDQLPISEKREKIAELIAGHQVVVVAGETGSGKTTQLPKICLSLGLGARGLIGHTQPRRLAAKSVAMRIAEECDSTVGDLVGYQVRFQDRVSDRSVIKLMTDGILLAEIQNDPYLRKYEVIIIDEAHERSLNIDFLMGYLKTLLPKRRDLKVIITSATIDEDRFSDFFNKAPVIRVSGRTYPVEVRYRPLNELTPGDDEDISVQQAIVQIVEEIDAEERREGKGPGDILVFMTGEREIRDTAKVLREQNFRSTHIMPLYARLSGAEQNRIFQPVSGRKIVLSTNVAETSLTVPGIRYVIDPGKVRISRYSYRSKVQRLPIEPISQASANQRKGRCGRVEAGVCFRLYSEEDFLSRPEFTDPEIVRTNLASVILQMAQLNLGDVKKFPFIERPDNRLINDGYKLLYELGAVSAKNKLTRVGRKLARIPVDPRLARMLVAAAESQCLTEALVICSALTIQDPRERPHDKQQAATQAHKLFEEAESDFLSFLKLWNTLESERQEMTNSQFRKYCQKHFISYLRYLEWRDLHRQLHLVFKELQSRENEAPASYSVVHKALLTGLLGQIGIKDEKHTYKGARNKVFYLFPGSALYKKPPKWVMCAELVETSRVYGRTVARIEPDWVEALASHLVKKQYSEPHWEKKRGQVIGYETVSLYGLPLVSRRPVNYASVDPELAREIFIRSALVENEIKTTAPFYHRNRQLINKLEQLENKTRRRDILVDDEHVFALYDAVIPKEVVSLAHFESWWKSLSKEQLEALNFTESQLSQKEIDQDFRKLYPDYFQTGPVRFRLDYQFDPGEQADGVTLIAPVAALKQLSEKKLEWVVPGYLKEKCTQLIKSLPKQYRRQFVPVPDYVEKVLPKLEPTGESLIAQLSRQLRFMTGVTIPPEVWKDVDVETHLKINIRVVDEKGKTLFESRNLDEVVERFGSEQVQTRAVSSLEGQYGQKGMTSWSFGSLPDEIKSKQAGVTIRMFPYLKDEGSSVSLLASTDKLFAERSHLKGLARLVLLQSQDQVDHVTETLPLFKKSALLFAPVGKYRELLDDFWLSLVQTLLRNRPSLPVTPEEFEKTVTECRGAFYEEAQRHDTLLFSVLTPYHECMKQTKGKINVQLVSFLNDVRQQLSRLVYPGFMQNTPYEWLQEFPRYFSATLIRLEKMPREVARERKFLLYFEPAWERYSAQKAKLEKHSIVNEALELYRWMLEEYRVSYFAQQLGTKLTISPERLEKQWALVEETLL